MQRRILFHGVVFLAFGFALGLVVPAMPSPAARMWLGSHVTALMVGLMVVSVGLLWPHLRLGPTGQRVLWWVTVPMNYVASAILGVFAPAMGVPSAVLTPDLPMPAAPVMAVFVIGLLGATLSAFTMSGLLLYGLRPDGSGD